MPTSEFDEILGPERGMLVAQDFRKLFSTGFWKLDAPDLETRLQPASFDPPTTNECFFVPDDFRCRRNTSVLETLRRDHTDWKRYPVTETGHVLAPNHTWLFPLAGEYALPEGTSLIHSPKSTHGRLGNHVRLLADYQEGYEEIRGPWKGHLFLLVHPHTFHMRTYPGLSFNQIRIFNGDRQRIDSDVLKRINKIAPLVYQNGEPAPANIWDDKLHLHFDFQGKNTAGVVALRIKPNPDVLDLRAKNLDILDYYAVETANEGLANGRDLLLNQGDNTVLAATLEQVRIPSRINLDDEEFSIAAQYEALEQTVGWGVRLHEAGFFDPGFGFGVNGELKGASAVLELCTGERRDIVIHHGMQAGGFEFFRTTRVPEMPYGEASGASYQAQQGVRPAKQFQAINFQSLAKKINKDRELIVAYPTEIVHGTGISTTGFTPTDSTNMALIERMNDAAAQSLVLRGPIERDPSHKQPIPYLIIYNPNTNQVFGYRRGQRREVYNETRLHGRFSLGVGGHAREDDCKQPNPLLACAQRELVEEVKFPGEPQFKHIGFLSHNSAEEVDAVHIGIVYAVPVTQEITAKSPEIHEGHMMTFAEARAAPNQETWTKTLLQQPELEALLRAACPTEQFK